MACGKLPNECLEVIFLAVTQAVDAAPSVLKTCSLVSQRWRQVAQKLLFAHIDVNGQHALDGVCALLEKRWTCSNIQRLRISGCFCLDGLFAIVSTLTWRSLMLRINESNCTESMRSTSSDYFSCWLYGPALSRSADQSSFAGSHWPPSAAHPGPGESSERPPPPRDYQAMYLATSTGRCGSVLASASRHSEHKLLTISTITC